MYYLDELNGRIDPGYERVENEMWFCTVHLTEDACISAFCGGDNPISNEIEARSIVGIDLDEVDWQEQRMRDIKQAKIAKVVVEALIDAVKASDGEFAKLVLSDKLAEITNKATRALLEI